MALNVKSTSPLLLDDLDILSTPISYVDFDVEFTDDSMHTVEISFIGMETIVYSGEMGPKMRSDTFSDDILNYAYLGQMPVEECGNI